MIQKFRRRIALAFFSVLLVSCEQNELTVPIPAIPSGGSYSAPSRSVPQNTPKAPPVATNQHPMIDNPDNPRETTLDDVYATDESDAQRRCEEIARSRSDRWATVRVKKVTRKTDRPYSSGKYKFECQLEIEYQ